MARRRRRRRVPKGGTSAWLSTGGLNRNGMAGVLQYMAGMTAGWAGGTRSTTWTMGAQPEDEPRVRWEGGALPREEDLERARGDIETLVESGGLVAWRESEERARDLLLSWLTPAQVQSIQDVDTFDVTSSTGRRWRIVAGRSIRNCVLLGADGRPERRFCLQQMALVPDDDACLAQKLLLETDEPGFLALAREAPLDSGAGWRLHSARAIVRWAVREGRLPAELGAKERLLYAPAFSSMAAMAAAGSFTTAVTSMYKMLIPVRKPAQASDPP